LIEPSDIIYHLFIIYAEKVKEEIFTLS